MSPDAGIKFIHPNAIIAEEYIYIYGSLTCPPPTLLNKYKGYT